MCIYKRIKVHIRCDKYRIIAESHWTTWQFHGPETVRLTTFTTLHCSSQWGEWRTAALIQSNFKNFTFSLVSRSSRSLPPHPLRWCHSVTSHDCTAMMSLLHHTAHEALMFLKTQVKLICHFIRDVKGGRSVPMSAGCRIGQARRGSCPYSYAAMR